MFNFAICHGKDEEESNHTYVTNVLYFYIGNGFFEVKGKGEAHKTITYEKETAIISPVSSYNIEWARSVGAEVIDL